MCVFQCPNIGICDQFMYLPVICWKPYVFFCVEKQSETETYTATERMNKGAWFVMNCRVTCNGSPSSATSVGHWHTQSQHNTRRATCTRPPSSATFHGPLAYTITTQHGALRATCTGPPSSATLHGPPANLRKVGNCWSAEKHICSATCTLRLKCVCTSVWSLQCYSITVLTNTQVCVKA